MIWLKGYLIGNIPSILHVTEEMLFFFISEKHRNYTLWSCQKVCKDFTFLLDNIYIRFGNKLFRQIAGISMGTNCTPLVADLFLFCYELHVVSFWRKAVWNYCSFQLDVYWDICITKTCLYSFDPFKPHFYIVKLGFTGVYIIFLIFARNIDCGYSLEPPCRDGSNEYPQFMFWAEIWKISVFFIWKFSFFGGKIICIFE